MFDPTAYVPDLTEAALRKVIRWAVTISSYTYECIHISGMDNVWADLMTRWTRPNTIRRLVTIPPLPSTDEESFEWPSGPTVRETQAQHTPPANCDKVYGLWKTKSQQIWIPEIEDDLHLRLRVIAHISAGGHRGVKSTQSALGREFYWGTML